MTWNCRHCKNDVDDNFDACWECGASVDGEKNLDFCHEIEATSIHQGGVRIIECAECGFRGKSVQVPAVSGWINWLLKIVFGITGASNLTNHACPDCDETRQIYDWKSNRDP